LPLSWFDTIVAPFWDDLAPGATGRVYWAVRGVAPQRELVIEWRNFEHFGLSSGTVTFQLVLFEDNSNALFNYADVIFGDPALDRGANAEIGIQSSAGIAREFHINEYSPQLSDGTSIQWQMPTEKEEKKKSWFRRTFLGAFDPQWIALLGVAAWLVRRQRLSPRA
jgi:hypothetical protein